MLLNWPLYLMTVPLSHVSPRRKYFYSDQNVDIKDPVQLNLLFVQVHLRNSNSVKKIQTYSISRSAWSMYQVLKHTRGPHIYTCEAPLYVIKPDILTITINPKILMTFIGQTC